MQKIEVAIEHLASALLLYDEGRFISALTLAASSQEILGAHIGRCAPDQTDSEAFQLSTLQLDARAIVQFDKTLGLGARTEHEIKRTLCASKNSAKHFNIASESRFEFAAQHEACNWLIRAILDYQTVFPEHSEQYQRQLEDLKAFLLNYEDLREDPERAEARVRDFESWSKTKPQADSARRPPKKGN